MRGRPKKEETRSRSMRVRINEDEEKILNTLCDNLEIDRSECIRRALRTLYIMQNNR